MSLVIKSLSNSSSGEKVGGEQDTMWRKKNCHSHSCEKHYLPIFLLKLSLYAYNYYHFIIIINIMITPIMKTTMKTHFFSELLNVYQIKPEKNLSTNRMRAIQNASLEPVTLILIWAAWWMGDWGNTCHWFISPRFLFYNGEDAWRTRCAQHSALGFTRKHKKKVYWGIFVFPLPFVWAQITGEREPGTERQADVVFPSVLIVVFPTPPVWRAVPSLSPSHLALFPSNSSLWPFYQRQLRPERNRAPPRLRVPRSVRRSEGHHLSTMLRNTPRFL